MTCPTGTEITMALADAILGGRCSCDDTFANAAIGKERTANNTTMAAPTAVCAFLKCVLESRIINPCSPFVHQQIIGTLERPFNPFKKSL
jgi:hypothetical protein